MLNSDNKSDNRFNQQMIIRKAKIPQKNNCFAETAVIEQKLII